MFNIVTIATLIGIPFLFNFIYVFKVVESKLKIPILIFLFTYTFDQYFLSTLFPALSFNYVFSGEISDKLRSYLFFLLICQIAFSFLLVFFINLFNIKKSKLKKFISLTLRNTRSLKYLGFLFYLSFLSWVISTKGLAITNPRVAYMDFRQGAGYIWALGCVTSSLFLCAKIASNKLKISETIFHFMIIYFYGSKGLILASFIAVFSAKRLVVSFSDSKVLYLIKKYSWIVYLTSLITIIGLLIINFGGFSADNPFIEKLSQYFSLFQNADKAVNENTKEFNNIVPKIIPTSFWSFVPRQFFPQKPIIYGQTLLVDYFYPGIAQIGHTPSFGPGISEYLTFGILGFVPYLLKFRIIFFFLSIKILSKTDSLDKPIYLFFYSFLILDKGISFHVPVIMVFLLSMVFTRLIYKKNPINNAM